MKFGPASRFACVLLPLWLAACGGGDSSSPAAAPAPAPAPTPADTQAPSATLTTPLDFSSGLVGTLALATLATDNVAVTGVEFQVDGVQVGSTVTAVPYAVNVDVAQYASGQHVVRSRALDAAGNVSPWSSATVNFGGTRTQPAGFTRNEGWITGLSGATAIAQAPDGRLFVAQQGGALRVVKNGALLGTPFMQLTVDSAGERGLIGVTTHPNFAANGYLYVYYTSTEGGSHNRISRFTANGDVLLAGSEVKLVELPNLSSATNHNGGALHFGADGKLYVGVGDNANSAQAPDLTKVFGKLLRFNDDGSIPTDNPFYATSSGQSRAVWAYGLRNPYTFAVQPGTGRIHVNDVGENTWEEVNLGAAGANYGWPNSEGASGVAAGNAAPIFSYKHSAASPAGSGAGGFFTGFAIAGGSFYPASGPFPSAYQGHYFFADFGSRFVARFDLANNAVYAFGNVSGNPVDMLAGADGALYVLTRDSIVRFSAP
ncbi:MAG: PQQ-dependent sugar dehydrogenase [Burkholderiales bacterium]